MEIMTTNPSAAVPLKGQADTAGTKLSSDFDTFLRMLTVQMQNQDPLNPVQSEDFAVQLATFSGVEQQVRTNDLLEALQSQMGVTGISQYAGWIGKEARAPVAAPFDGTPITVAPSPLADADEAFMVVHDSYGREVQRISIPVSDAPVTWDGSTASGPPVPDGQYSFSVESWRDGGLQAITDAEVYSVVQEARVQNGGIVLVLEGGAEIAADQVSALRDAA